MDNNSQTYGLSWTIPMLFSRSYITVLREHSYNLRPFKYKYCQSKTLVVCYLIYSQAESRVHQDQAWDRTMDSNSVCVLQELTFWSLQKIAIYYVKG